MIHSTQTDFLATRYGIEKAVDMLIEAGYAGIDVSMYTFNQFPYVDDYREKCASIKEKADKAGVKFVQAHGTFGGGKDSVEKHVEAYKRAFEVCELLGIPIIVIHPITLGTYNNYREQSNAFNLQFYKDLAPLAKKHGIKIAIENMWTIHPVKKTILDAACEDPRDLMWMYDELNDPETFTICVDIGHVALCDREPEDYIRIIGGERLGCIHAHDVDYKSDLHILPGAAKLHWDEICKALAEVGYKGCFNLEADNFYKGFLPEHDEVVTKFMCEVTRIFANKVESYRKEG